MALPARSRGAMEATQDRSLAIRAFELPVQKFIHTEGVGGWLLLAAAVVAILWVNSPWSAWYTRLWEAEISFNLGFLHLEKSLQHWINDFLMAIFFFLVGMEIKRELVLGELRTAKRALLPVIAAFGGMAVPAFLYYALNYGTTASSGWGIPMATDIAFALGLLAMIKGVPVELKVFLLALAIVDDIGAIVVIAIFYSGTVSLMSLFIGVLLLGGILALRRASVQNSLPYVVLGLFFWICVLNSGIHATIAGVILGLLVSTQPAIDHEAFALAAPAHFEAFRQAHEEGDEYLAECELGAIEGMTALTDPPVERITARLHSWVAFLILPIFALSNAGVVLSITSLRQALAAKVAWGVAAGLVLGKPLGILAFSWIAVKLRIVELPEHFTWRLLAGVGTLAGIGFTVSIFITGLAFEMDAMVAQAKIATLAASAFAGLLGWVILHWAVRKSPTDVSIPVEGHEAVNI